MREELMTANSLHRSNAARKMLPREERYRKFTQATSINPGSVMAEYYIHNSDINSEAAASFDPPAQEDHMQLGSYWVESFRGNIVWPPDPDPVPSATPWPAEKVNLFFSRKGRKREGIPVTEEGAEEAPVRATPTESPIVSIAESHPAEFYLHQQFQDLEEIQEELSQESTEGKKKKKKKQKLGTAKTQKITQTEGGAMKQREEHHHELKTVEEHEDEDEEIDISTLTRYPPPSVLRQLPPNDSDDSGQTPGAFPETDEDESDSNSESEARLLIREIVQSSVDRVLEQAKVENARLQQLQEQEAAAEQDRGKGKGKARADDDGNANNTATAIPAIRISSNGEASSSAAAAAAAAAASGSSTGGKSRFKLGRLFRGNKSGTTAQGSTGSSEASSSRETLSPQTSNDPTTSEEKLYRSPLLKFIKKRRKTASGSSTETMECIACFTDLPPKQLVPTPCKHLYCQPCFKSLITTTLDSNSEANWPPKCCLTPIPYRTITKHTHTRGGGALLLQRYKAKEAEYSVPADQRVYCSTPDCGEWIPPTRKYMDKAAKTARCPSKGHVMCLMCLGAPHKTDSETCPQDRDLQLLDEIADESGWRRCFKCHMLVEHREACAHMTCRCGAQFCYICGAKWRTCECDPQELVRIKERAEMKRWEREARDLQQVRNGGEGSSSAAAAVAGVVDDAEAEWLAYALGLIEEMTREEERREEEWREQQRLQREEARLAQLEQRFVRLQVELLGVQNWQRTVLLSAQTRETDACIGAAVRKRDEVREKLDRERMVLRVESAAKIADREAEWKKEYAARVAWEKELEEQYALSLARNELVKEKQKQAALVTYMKKNDARRDEWRKRRDEELERFRQGVQEELGVSEGLIDALVRRAEKTVDDELREVRRRHKAEFRWFELATAERNRLLVEMEAVERENGAEMADDDSDDEYALSLDDRVPASRRE